MLHGWTLCLKPAPPPRRQPKLDARQRQRERNVSAQGRGTGNRGCIFRQWQCRSLLEATVLLCANIMYISPSPLYSVLCALTVSLLECVLWYVYLCVCKCVCVAVARPLSLAHKCCVCYFLLTFDAVRTLIRNCFFLVLTSLFIHHLCLICTWVPVLQYGRQVFVSYWIPSLR